LILSFDLSKNFNGFILPLGENKIDYMGKHILKTYSEYDDSFQKSEKVLNPSGGRISQKNLFLNPF
jgi:hypothetical protein